MRLERPVESVSKHYINVIYLCTSLYVDPAFHVRRKQMVIVTPIGVREVYIFEQKG